jgi:hypothetical protein
MRQINTLLCAFREGPPSRIHCEDFIDWVFTDAAPACAKSEKQQLQSPSVPSYDEDKRLLESYTSGFVRGIRQFSNEMDFKAMVRDTGSSGDMKAFQQAVLERWVAYVQEVQCQGLAAVWHYFDGDHDGILTLEECVRFLTAYLQRSADAVEELVQASVELGLDIHLAVLSGAEAVSSNETTTSEEEVRSCAKTRAHLLNQRLVPAIREVLQEAGGRNIHAAARELLDFLCVDNPSTQVGGGARISEERLAEGLRQVLAPAQRCA